MSSRDNEASGEKHFAFGKNWQRFLRVLNDERIAEAEKSMRTMLDTDSLCGKSFLDIGSGSGLFSLAAMRLAASRVHSFDYDRLSVACTKELKRRYFPDSDHWTIEEGSILDAAYLTSLGQFDIVYSWGVLHHTGNMWGALQNSVLPLGQSGKLFVAIYNDQGWVSRYWSLVKKTFNNNVFFRGVITVIYLPYLFGGRFLLRALTGRLQLERGMSLWYDMKDWLGGYPFEVAKPEAIFSFYREIGFNLLKLKTCGGRQGCNEYVFVKCAK